MAKIERFEDLDVWKEAVSIGVKIGRLKNCKIGKFEG